MKVSSITEMNLTANQPIDKLQKLHWKTEDNKSNSSNNKQSISGTVVTLNPMEIKTFIVKLSV